MKIGIIGSSTSSASMVSTQASPERKAQFRADGSASASSSSKPLPEAHA